MVRPSLRLGDYELGGVVGHGLVGALCEGVYVPGLRDVMLEEIPTDLVSDAGFTRRLGDAGRTASAITSRHLVSVYDIIVIDSKLLVVSEPPGGPSLATVIALEPLTPAAGFAVMCDVLYGLAELHALGISHGHVGPATVFVTPAGEARLGDVAVAVARSSGSEAADIEATLTLVTRLTGNHPLPTPMEQALLRVPGSAEPGACRNAADFAQAIDKSAASVFGGDWRQTNGLAERVQHTPKSTVALDLVALASSPTKDPVVSAPPMISAQSGATVTLSEPAGQNAAKHRKHRVWPWLLAAVMVAGASGGTAAIITRTNAHAPAAKAAPLTIGNDLTLASTRRTGGCDTTFMFTATGSVTGSGDIRYQWERNDGTVPDITTAHVSDSDASFRFTQGWRLMGSQTFNGTMTFHILAPAERKVSQTFAYTCS